MNPWKPSSLSIIFCNFVTSFTSYKTLNWKHYQAISLNMPTRESNKGKGNYPFPNLVLVQKFSIMFSLLQFLIPRYNLTKPSSLPSIPDYSLILSFWFSPSPSEVEVPPPPPIILFLKWTKQPSKFDVFVSLSDSSFFSFHSFFLSFTKWSHLENWLPEKLLNNVIDFSNRHAL